MDRIFMVGHLFLILSKQITNGRPFVFNSIKTDNNSEKPIQAYDNLDITEEAKAMIYN